MLVLCLRTDKPEAEITLYETDKKLAEIKWQAHYKLAETIHQKMTETLASVGKELNEVQGIIVYRGPGSFTGLRIGLSVANAMAYGLGVPIVGTTGDNWKHDGLAALSARQNDKIVAADYGAEAHITKPVK